MRFENVLLKSFMESEVLNQFNRYSNNNDCCILYFSYRNRKKEYYQQSNTAYTLNKSRIGNEGIPLVASSHVTQHPIASHNIPEHLHWLSGLLTCSPFKTCHAYLPPPYEQCHNSATEEKRGAMLFSCVMIIKLLLKVDQKSPISADTNQPPVNIR